MNGLPDALRSLASSVQWVAWDSVNGRKVPKSAYGGNAKANDPTTWSTFEEAAEAARKNGYAGIGIELDNGLIGIDLDHCMEDGKLKPWAQEIVDAIGSYAEISPSGDGVHILALASTDKVGAVGRADHTKGIEVYNHGRYFTVTGNAINDVPLSDSTEQVQELLKREFPSESNGESLKKAFGRLVRDQVARKANETVMHNVERDRRSGVRFARVPMGFHTCDFCMMLASRGFVYWSRQSAGEFSHYHSDCRCKVVPGRPEIRSYVKNGVHVTRGFDASVEGYDPDTYMRILAGPGKRDRSIDVHLSSEGDPAKEYYGSIDDEERRRFEQRCRELGVDVMESSEENIVYGPGVGQCPPQIRIPKSASYLAHCHELDHAELDAKNGSPGIAYYIDHPEARIEMERHAYGLEIEKAKADGYTDLAERLQKLLDKEVSRIERESQ